MGSYFTVMKRDAKSVDYGSHERPLLLSCRSQEQAEIKFRDMSKTPVKRKGPPKSDTPEMDNSSVQKPCKVIGLPQSDFS